MNVVWRNKQLLYAAALACALLLSGRAQAVEWRVEVVDPSGSAQFTSMKIDSVGNVHVAYVPEMTGHPLKYAFWDHAAKRWFTMTVAPVASFCTLVLDSHERPHISYADHGTGLGAKLRHAYWDGKVWKVEPINIQLGAVVAYYTSIALDKNDNPFFSYYDYADPTNSFRLRMRSVSWVTDHWEARTVDAQGGSGKFNSIAVDSKGVPHIAYANVKYESSGLRYATWTGNTWKTEIVEGRSGPTPLYSVGMMLDGKDNPHIAYTLTEARRVKYATRVEGKWQTEIIDAIGQEAYPDRNGIALDAEGNPYVSYYDGKTGVLKIAHKENGKWIGEVLDSNFAGFTSSLVIDHDTLWVSYADQAGGSLKVASRPLHEKTAETSTAAAKVSNK